MSAYHSDHQDIMENIWLTRSECGARSSLTLYDVAGASLAIGRFLCVEKKEQTTGGPQNECSARPEDLEVKTCHELVWQQK